MQEPTSEDVAGTAGPMVLEFGAEWCPHCQAIQPHMAEVLASHPNVRHVKVEDGKGKPLGRAFRVKLWPTLVFLRDGAEVGRAVRPTGEEIEKGFAGIA